MLHLADGAVHRLVEVRRVAPDVRCLDDRDRLLLEVRAEELPERAVVIEARRLVEHDPDIGARSVLVVSGDGWHRGVIGIVAARLSEEYGRPAFVVGFDGDTGQVLYAGGGTNELMANVRRFETAIVARGRIFVAGDNTLYAFTP